MNKRIEMWEWSLIFMSVRYAMGRESAASATLPADIVTNFWSRLSEGNKAILYRDLKEHFDQFGTFGNPNIDNRYWCKFMEALNTKAHFTLKYKGKEYVVFNALGRTYPLDEYVKQPHAEIYIKPEEADK